MPGPSTITRSAEDVARHYNVDLVTADTAVSSKQGFLHTVTFTCNDAAPTAGSIIIFDNTAESGKQILNHTFTTTPFLPVTVILDCEFYVGLYVGFTTTADVNCTVTWK